MPLPLSLLLSLLLLMASNCPIAFGHDRSLASLAQKWNMTDPEFSYSSLGFTLQYIVSDFILDEMISQQIYNKDCGEGGVAIPSTVLNPQISTQVVTPGEGDNPRNVNVTIMINPETISGSSIYSEEEVNGQMTAQVRYCHRMMLTTVGAAPIEVNFRETLVTLTIDLTDGFEVGGVSVTPRDQLIETANQIYEVEAFQCNANNLPLTESQLITSRVQGSIVRVCVRPDQIARDDGVFMRWIDSFTWSRDFGGNIGPVTQEAIVNKLPASNQLTVLFCERGQEICAFESLLMAVFYRFDGLVQGSGVASMQFGDSPGGSVSRRLRRGLQEERELQEAPAAAIAEFDLDMDVLPLFQRDSSGSTLQGGKSFFWMARWIHMSVMLLLLQLIL